MKLLSWVFVGWILSVPLVLLIILGLFSGGYLSLTGLMLGGSVYLIVLLFAALCLVILISIASREPLWATSPRVSNTALFLGSIVSAYLSGEFALLGRDLQTIACTCTVAPGGACSCTLTLLQWHQGAILSYYLAGLFFGLFMVLYGANRATPHH